MISRKFLRVVPFYSTFPHWRICRFTKSRIQDSFYIFTKFLYLKETKDSMHSFHGKIVHFHHKNVSNFTKIQPNSIYHSIVIIEFYSKLIWRKKNYVAVNFSFFSNCIFNAFCRKSIIYFSCSGKMFCDRELRRLCAYIK